MRPDERSFEEAIEASLLAGGYIKSRPAHFDPVLGLDTSELFAFIGVTQGQEWSGLIDRHGGDPDTAQAAFAKRLARELDRRGSLDVLRHGVTDLGVTLQLAYFRPAHSLTPELVARYDANRVSLTRQLPYDPASNKTIDLALLLNGIPTATAELKNPLTGQSINHAISQYRTDRDPSNLTLARRALVHFALDPDLVAMTTRLAGPATAFLPFNRGHDRHAGNPPNPGGHRSAYLWERVWARDAWMDLLARFLHTTKTKETVFPRFHQWDAVIALEADARARGPGRHYLVQHSAGSGKSNTIAWTAHRLSVLHDAADQRVFDKVVVITDRVVLDRQLQETVYQFEHTRGVVERIEHDSAQLARALSGEQARIIVTTLQKFPFVLEKLATRPARRYAVIVDEAHSSQTGDAARDLRLVLGPGVSEQAELTLAEAEDAGYVATNIDPVEEALAGAVKGRGQQSNISFFAFTATPKGRTLEMFGTFDPAINDYRPFHLYSMRQAIEEGFILDVLRNYTTYSTYWHIEKAIRDDPAYEVRKANAAIARFVGLHPSHLAQKAEIIVEHFRTHVAARIGGRAKAMVVTASRLAAVRFRQAIEAYLAKAGYDEPGALVAFSGRVVDEGGLEYTEAQMNRFPERQTAERFGTDDYRLLVVAEKFQTGFDQPLLQTMYVDKPLLGLAAVQALSRLNRIHPEKADTFVLDFRNQADDIVAAFAPYYGETIAPPSDPNLLYDTRAVLDDYDVMRADEVEVVAGLLLGVDSPEGPGLSGEGRGRHGALYAALDPALERFRALADEDRLGFRDALDRFVRTYAFLSQVVSFTDTKLERYYVYCRALATRLTGESSIERLDLGAEVELTHLRTQLTFGGALSLDADTGEVRSIYGEGGGREGQGPTEILSEIVSELNTRFGMGLDDCDRLLFEQFEASWLADPEVLAQARANTLESFRLAFDQRFMATVVGRMDDNEAIFKRVLDDSEFRGVLMDLYAARVYRRARASQGDGQLSLPGDSLHE